MRPLTRHQASAYSGNKVNNTELGLHLPIITTPDLLLYEESDDVEG
jgi:hypothetical protein